LGIECRHIKDTDLSDIWFFISKYLVFVKTTEGTWQENCDRYAKRKKTKWIYIHIKKNKSY